MSVIFNEVVVKNKQEINWSNQRHWKFIEKWIKKTISSKEDFLKIKWNELKNILFRWIDFLSHNFGFTEFWDCIFDWCNLSLIDIENTLLQNVEFKNCKIVWVNFSIKEKELISINFKNCSINLSYFSDLKLKNISFEWSEIIECNFRDSNLSKWNFKNCNLDKTIFDKTNLSFTNFIWAKNYSINPTSNILKKAIFSYPEAFWLLNYFDIKIKF